MTCRQCGTEIAGNALICYRCGSATSAPRVKPPAIGSVFDRPRRRWTKGVVTACVLLAVAVVLWFVFGTP